MGAKALVGVAITALALILLLYSLVYVGLTAGSIGGEKSEKINLASARVIINMTKGSTITRDVTVPRDSLLVATGFLLLLLGPWLWLGDTPVSLKKFVEAKTGRRL